MRIHFSCVALFIDLNPCFGSSGHFEGERGEEAEAFTGGERTAA